MSYLPHLQDEIMSSIFRAKRDGMHVKKRNSNGTLQKTNKVSFLDKNSKVKTFEVKAKAHVAEDIWKEIISRLND